MGERGFPIHPADRGKEFGSSVPWSFVEPHRKQAKDNHSQSLETLADRGGLDIVELYWVVTGRPWKTSLAFDRKACATERVVAVAELRKLLDAHDRAPRPGEGETDET